MTTSSSSSSMSPSAAGFDTIAYSDLSPEQEWTRLGKGSFGCVWKAEYLGLEVAVKEVLQSKEYNVDKYLERECRILSASRHPNIVQLIGFSLAPAHSTSVPPLPRLLIVSEYLPRGNLRTYIADKSIPFPWRLRLSFAIDVARGLTYLHARQCMHRDLKGENLLVTENERIKVCDFGFARIAAQNEEEMKRITFAGTDGYMSPEILLGEEFGLPTDVFSFGVILAELASRRLADQHTFARSLPTFGVSFDEVLRRASPHCPPDLVQLSLACLDVDPSKRPKMLDVLSRLREIEKQVHEAESKGLSPEPGSINLPPGHGSWNVGSVSFAGTSKRGKGKRPQAPRLPSFEGRVKVGSSRASSYLSARDDRADEDSDSGDEVALLGLADYNTLDSNLEWHDPVPKDDDPFFNDDMVDENGHSRYSTALLGRNSKARLNIEELASCLRDSNLTVKVSPQRSLEHNIHSNSIVIPSQSASPDDWISNFTRAPTSPSNDVVPIVIDSTPDEAKVDLPTSSLHRFSLIKPTLQRLLQSFSLTTSSLNVQMVNPSTLPTFEFKHSNESTNEKEGGGQERLKTRSTVCQLCEKKLGWMKSFLECDDCGYR
ncbi:hypothetical protein ACM66B_006869 [Microbotryomycetes sp. NB124-2]